MNKISNKKKVWKLCPFKEGDVFEVSRDISAKRARFIKGEILVFNRADQSEYDGMTEYIFKSDSGKYKIFDMADSDGIEKLTSFFKATEKKPKFKKSFKFLIVLIIVALTGVTIRIIFDYEYLKESLKTQPLYVAGACFLGVLAYYIKWKLTR